MPIMRWNPSRTISPWLDLWENELDNLGAGPTYSGMEVYETEKEVVVKVNVPGIPSEKIDLTFEKGVLYVNAQSEQEDKNEDKSGKRTYYSRATRSVKYRVQVPGEIDPSVEPEAQVDSGVLTISFTKSQHALPRKLQIKSKK